MSHLVQRNFIIHNLLYHAIKLPRKTWLKKNEIFLKQQGVNLVGCVLARNEIEDNKAAKNLMDYLKMCSLVSETPQLEDFGGQSLNSQSDFGKKIRLINGRMSIDISEDAKGKISQYFPAFIKETKKLYKKYDELIDKNPFLELGVSYSYDSEIKSVYKNEGFVNAMMSLEAILNEGPGDISHKIAIRTAFLLSFSTFDSINVFRNMKKFYKFRNDIVHGKLIKKIDDQGLIRAYSVACLRMVLILCYNRKHMKGDELKTCILKEIDESMLDYKRRIRLQKELSRGLKYFKLSLPRKIEKKSNGRIVYRYYLYSKFLE